jgi:hypothetical protein
MTDQETLRVTASRLRKAVSEGAHARAGAALLEYRRQLEEALAGLPPEGREIDELEREPQALLEWARLAVLASRAAAATRLKHLPRPMRAYRAVPARAHHTWELCA